MPENDDLKERLMRAIAEFDGVPSVRGLAKAIGTSPTPIKKIFREQPEIACAMEKRGTEYLRGLNSEELSAKYATKGWTGNLPEYAQLIVEQSLYGMPLRERIAREIDGYEGIPTIGGLTRRIANSDFGRIDKIVEGDTELAAAMEKKGRGYIYSLNLEDLRQRWSEHVFVKAPRYAQLAAEERLYGMSFRERIAKEIDGYEGIPTCTGISKKIENSNHASIYKFVGEDPALAAAMEKKGRDYIYSLSLEDLSKVVKDRHLLGNVPKYAQDIIERILYGAPLRERIANEICKYDGIPTIRSLADTFGNYDTTIRKIVEGNPALAAAMEKKGREYLAGLDIAELKKKWSKSEFANMPEYAQKLVEERLFGMALEKRIAKEIGDSAGETNVNKLARQIGAGRLTILHRIERELDLWIAFHTKRGLTIDQAIELAIEREDAAPAATEVGKQRIKHLSAYREMFGVIKTFGDLLQGKILGISLYPKPLSRAAELLGMELDIASHEMQKFRKGKLPKMESANVAVIQGMHRLGVEELTQLLESVYSALETNGSVIATFSSEYSFVSGFENAFNAKGFKVQEIGAIDVEAPAMDTIPAQDAEMAQRIFAKIRTSFNAVLLRKESACEDGSAPILEKIIEERNGNGVFVPGAGADVPDDAMRRSTATFLQRVEVLPEGPYLAEIQHEGRTVALAGFGLHPRHRNMVESATYAGAPQEDYRALARKLARNAELRNDLKIRPNSISKVPLEKVVRP